MSGMVEAPEQDCPKCGEHDAFSAIDPRYREALWQGGWGLLEWSCIRCGYVLTTPTVDAKPEPARRPEPPYTPPATPIGTSETSWATRLRKLGLR